MAVDPVGIVEIADRLGVERGTVQKWRTRNLLPEPRWTVGGRPAWAWADIETWARTTGRALTPSPTRFGPDATEINQQTEDRMAGIAGLKTTKAGPTFG